MANIKSQIKRNKTNEKARQRNKAVRSELRTSLNHFHKAVESGDAEAAQAQHRATARLLDKAAGKGVIHKNAAANKKSALAKHLHAATESTDAS